MAKFIGDIIYRHTWQGILCLATVFTDRMRAQHIDTALRNAKAKTLIQSDAT